MFWMQLSQFKAELSAYVLFLQNSHEKTANRTNHEQQYQPTENKAEDCGYKTY